MDPTLMLQDEYARLSETHHHYSNLRFSILTAFIALTGGLLAITYGQLSTSMPSLFVTSALKVGGILITFVFWRLEERLNAHIDCFEIRFRTLEQSLKYDIYTSLVNKKYRIQVHTTMRVFYLSVFGFWIISLIFNP